MALASGRKLLFFSGDVSCPEAYHLTCIGVTQLKFSRVESARGVFPTVRKRRAMSIPLSVVLLAYSNCPSA